MPNLGFLCTYVWNNQSTIYYHFFCDHVYLWWFVCIALITVLCGRCISNSERFWQLFKSVRQSLPRRRGVGSSRPGSVHWSCMVVLRRFIWRLSRKLRGTTATTASTPTTDRRGDTARWLFKTASSTFSYATTDVIVLQNGHDCCWLATASDQFVEARDWGLSTNGTAAILSYSCTRSSWSTWWFRQWISHPRRVLRRRFIVISTSYSVVKSVCSDAATDRFVTLDTGR